MTLRCPVCEEAGLIDGAVCESCGGSGVFELTNCPREFVGRQVTEAVNIASLCTDGIMPIEGGLLDQSAWFVSIWQQLLSEQAQIDAERIEKQNHAWQ